jgi:hypothetical protein
VLKMTQGDNGEYSWVFDSNGKVQKTTNPDELAVQRRDIRIRLSDQEYADPNSEIFTVTFGGIDTANGNDCYAIKISSNINADVFTYYVNTMSTPRPFYWKRLSRKWATKARPPGGVTIARLTV